MRRTRLVGLAALVALGAACSGGPTDNGGNNNQPNYPNNPGGTPVLSANVSVNDNFYSPNSVNLSAGGTVTWTWVGDEGHSVTPESSGSFSPTAPVSFPPKTLAVTFATAGTYQYYCTAHGADAYGQQAMVGSIFVQ